MVVVALGSGAFLVLFLLVVLLFVYVVIVGHCNRLYTGTYLEGRFYMFVFVFGSGFRETATAVPHSCISLLPLTMN